MALNDQNYNPFCINEKNTPDISQSYKIHPKYIPDGIDHNVIMHSQDKAFKLIRKQRTERIFSKYLNLLPSSDIQENINFLINLMQEGNYSDKNLLSDVLELKKMYMYEKQRSFKEKIFKSVSAEISSDLLNTSIFYKNKDSHFLTDAFVMAKIEKNFLEKNKQKETKKRKIFCKEVIEELNFMKDMERNRKLEIENVYKSFNELAKNFEREESKRIEKETKEKLKNLKMTDESGYFDYIKESKENRINLILKKTDEYIEEICKRLKIQTCKGSKIQTDDLKNNKNIEKTDENNKFYNENIEKADENNLIFNDENFTNADENNKIDDEINKFKDENFEIADKNDFKFNDETSIINKNTSIENNQDLSSFYTITEKIETQPKNLTLPLKDYQLKGVEWMVNLYNNNLNGILADEMGLGKTIQTIGLISYLHENKNASGPFLIVVPLSTISNWYNEFKKWNPSLKIIEYKGSPESRKNLQKTIKDKKFNVIITTYEYILKDKSFLAKINWHFLIVDEGHRLKNKESKLGSIFNTKYFSKYRLILTGTPLQNSLPELWSILNFVLPQIFNSLSSFEDWFNAPLSFTNERLLITEEEKELIIQKLHKILRPFLLRRLKKDVATELPQKVERVLKVRMSKIQRIIYDEIKKVSMKRNNNYERIYSDSKKKDDKKNEEKDEIKKNFIEEKNINNEEKGNYYEEKNINIEKNNFNGEDTIYNEEKNNNEEKKNLDFYKNYQRSNKILDEISNSNNGLMQLRKICNHPFIFEGVENKINPLGLNNHLLYTLSGKFNVLNNILYKLKETNHRILMFFQMTQIMTIMEDFLVMQNFKYLRLDGNKRSDERSVLIDSFNNDTSYFIFLLSTRAGGLGINLTSADTVIIFDSDWNPHADLQAQDRAHRIGQKNEVRIIRLVTKDSIEEYMMERAIMKLDLDTKVIQAGRFDQNYDFDDEEILLQENKDSKNIEIGFENNNSGSIKDFLEEDDKKKKKFIVENGKDFIEKNSKDEKDNQFDKILKPDLTIDINKNKLSFCDEINELLARDEAELQIFKSIDFKRNDKELNEIDDFGIFEWENEIKEEPVKKIKLNENNEKENIVKKKEILYNKIINAIDEQGRLRIIIFRELPSKKEYPEYYKIIKTPISVNTIKRKLKNNNYSIDNLKNDFLLMFKNAMTFNMEGSIVYEDAFALNELTLEEYKELCKK